MKERKLWKDFIVCSKDWNQGEYCSGEILIVYGEILPSEVEIPIGEFAIEFIQLRSNIAPQLRMFHDSWKALTDLPELFKLLAENDKDLVGDTITEDSLPRMLERLGYRDRTQYTNPNTPSIKEVIINPRHKEYFELLKGVFSDQPLWNLGDTTYLFWRFNKEGKVRSVAMEVSIADPTEHIKFELKTKDQTVVFEVATLSSVEHIKEVVLQALNHGLMALGLEELK